MRRILSSVTDGRGFDILLVSITMIFLLALSGMPLVYNVVMSFQEVDMFNLNTFSRPYAGLENYREVVSQPEFGLILKNTAFFVFGSIAGQFVLGFALAMFFMMRFPFAATIRGVFLVSWVMPGLVVGALWGWILAGDFGVLNAILKGIGVIDSTMFWKSDPRLSIWAVTIANIWLGLAFNMMLLSVGLAAIPRDLYEAAELDGANGWHRFTTMTLPMMRSTIGAVLALGLIYTLQQFDLFPAITEGGPANSSNVAQYWAWQYSFLLFDFAKGATVSVMMLGFVLIASIVYVWSTRHEVRG
ncbi:putative sugar uptake ABC transporter permease protein [Oceanicola granulosus HTCC2516]|uniref:Putative sugar uptake ABC transporter permease protein n=1 Tax=Oceanicola granulosus (strain ATCC BAA-861 / DSM 15982 / KCTC 12143 / HTCC2516) TaxID=314256 RepID=Q2CKB2_OCEGH|nr:sugar ABC transporter permease [Oceanicola granulosus]EAR52877.1 putative sugar uptake ABC transporter permease protein [Oceanicola granulosus HTCC2516]